NAVDTKDIILKRSTGNGLLCMFQIRRNNDQISSFYWPDFPVKQKLSFPVQYKENFCKRMCVKHTGPVFFIFGQRDGQQPGINFRNLIFFYGIMSVAHIASFLLLMSDDKFYCRNYTKNNRRKARLSG